MKCDVIDADGHIIEVKSELQQFGKLWGYPPSLEAQFNRIGIEAWRGAISPRIREGAFDPHERLKDMDREGITVAVGFPTLLLNVSDFSSPEASLDACIAYNNWYANTYHAVSPSRFVAPALVPFNNVEAAVRELERAVTQLGAVALYAPPYSGEKHLDDPAFDPVWATAQEMGVPVGIHGGRNNTEPRLAASDFRTQLRFHALCHPFQQMMAMADLVCGGVLERFPRLKVAFLEAGIGWVPYFMARLDQDVMRMAGAEPRLTGKPADYLRGGNCYFSCDPDEECIPLVAGIMGEDSIIYASDYPHWDCRFPESVKLVQQNGTIPERLKKKVLSDNVKTLYNL